MYDPLPCLAVYGFLGIDPIRRDSVALSTGPLWREGMVWLTLFVVARASIRYGSAIVFS